MYLRANKGMCYRLPYCRFCVAAALPAIAIPARWSTLILHVGHALCKALMVHESLTRSVKSVLCVQDDLLYETLTVYETLYFAAMLRLPSTMSTEQKIQRVDHVIRTLGLDKCKDTIVGEEACMIVHS